MIEEIIAKDRRLRIDYNNILNSEATDKDLLHIVEAYLSDYCKYKNLTSTEVLEIYNRFVSEYMEDLRTFVDTGKYPLELGIKKSFNRTDYDIALILSVVFNQARHQIFSRLKNYLQNSQGSVLIIGVGAALELEILKQLDKNRDVHAYDLSISDFVFNRFSCFKVYSEEYKAPPQAKYNTVLAIELLEHLDTPMAFCELCIQSLSSKGVYICTTATNMPQFDHTINFAQFDFDKAMSTFAVTMDEKTDYIQPYMGLSQEAKNTWYLFKNAK